MTQFQKYALAVCAGLLLAAALGVSFQIGRAGRGGGPNLPVQVRVDTLTIRDTVREFYPVYRDRWKTRTELVEVRDTVCRTDTLYMAIDIERREYRGADFRAVVEGWRPVLAEIETYPKTVYLQTQVTQPVAPAPRKPRFGFGITAGPAAVWTPAGIKAGVGVAGGITVEF